MSKRASKDSDGPTDDAAPTPPSDKKLRSMDHALCAWGEKGMTPVFVEGLKGVQQIAFCDSLEYAVALTKDGELRRWGADERECDEVSPNEWNLSSKPLVDEKFKSIQGGCYFAAISEEGKIYVMGTGYLAESSYCPKLVSSLQTIPMQQVSCGKHHILALSETGTVFSWGQRWCSEYSGHGKGKQCEPKLIKKLKDVKISKIATYSCHSAVASDCGKVYTWGSDDDRILGHKENCWEPCEVDFKVNSIKNIVCGSNFSAILAIDGQVYTWGMNGYGQLGLGHHDDISGLCQIPAFAEEPVQSIYCRGTYTFAVTSTGKTFSWGYANYGIHGQGTKRSIPSPREVQGLLSCHVQFIALSAKSGIALVDSSTVPKNDAVSVGQACLMMLDDDDFSDVTFLVENQPIRAHRCFLAQRSEVFRTMFLNGMKESTQHTITIKDTRFVVFRKLLRYFYTGNVTVDADDIVVELYRLADMHHLPFLKQKCALSCKEVLSVENAAKVLCAASGYGELKQVCIRYVQKNFEKVSKTKGMEYLYGRTDLLKEVIEGKSLR